MNILTGSVIFSFVSCIIFTVVILVFSYHGVEVPDTLIQMFFTVFGVEFGATAAIKISSHIIKSKEVQDKISALKSENLPIEKSDLEAITDEESEGGYYYG